MSSLRTFRELEQGRSNNFDFLRFFFAYLVILSHSYPVLLGSNDNEPLFRLTGGQRTLGELSVDGFFLISGYLITASWQRSRGLIDYLRRRVLRIYPGFLVAVAFSSLIAAPLISPDPADYWQRFRFVEFVKQAINLQGAYSPDPSSINGSLWSIRYEFLCYLGLAAFGLMGLLRRRAFVLGFAVFCTALQVAMIYYGMEMPGSRLSWLWCFPGFWPRLACCYFVGAAFHLYAERIVRSGWLALVCAAILLGAGLIPGSKALPLVLSYCGGYLLFCFAFSPVNRLKDISRRGDLSYGLYLYAMPLQHLLAHHFRASLSVEGFAAIAMLVTTGFAALSWHCVERPFLRLKKATSSTPNIPAMNPATHPAILPSTPE